MSEYLYTIKTVKYGDAATTNSMPTGLSPLPNTVKGSVTLDEAEGETTEFYVDQQVAPVRSVDTGEAKLTAQMQFYDMSFTTLAAIKGGNGDASGYAPATGYSSVNKAIEIECDSGHKFLMYNAKLSVRIVGGLSRDNMLSVEMKAVPQLTSDNAGTWKIEKVFS